jgi:CBS domain-containing protein
VYDYVDGKVDWMAYGLPVEGEDGPFVGERVEELPTCGPDQTVADARSRLEESGADEVVVVAAENLAIGLVDAEALEGAGADDRLLDVMAPVPGAIRPSVTAASLADRDVERVLVTTPDGLLLGMVSGGADTGQDDGGDHHHDHPPELEQVERELTEVMDAARERFGDREPTEEELHELLRDRLVEEGRSPEEADRFMAELRDRSPS